MFVPHTSATPLPHTRTIARSSVYGPPRQGDLRFSPGMVWRVTYSGEQQAPKSQPTQEGRRGQRTLRVTMYPCSDSLIPCKATQYLFSAVPKPSIFALKWPTASALELGQPAQERCSPAQASNVLGHLQSKAHVQPSSQPARRANRGFNTVFGLGESWVAATSAAGLA